ncbi:beta-ketoacyl-[acyl-carrier-protein] synthase family protein [Streptomyces hainanensis]|uniref:Beta-ketoacyl-[acyl-carrier-protein] synthase family protein n=1 Tax=Streptomyces hainanensis TaxID=402648 RepID=A0A4R4SP77_9ACTN|nr:beta-ketoacyl-[acyl-carrier-protein] synthase family protein [Streptomyces hainanensis]TDC64009.1 beta-ketoacyl-[acyl-carrier-protein] synthase family protein [Streptomyces hainanensis]
MPGPGADAAAVTGLGMITPGGPTAEATWATLCAGRGLARTDPELAGLPVDFSCRVDGFDPDFVHGRRLARRLDRFAQLGLAAARQAVADAKLDPDTWAAARVGVVIGAGSNSLETYPREFARLDQGHPTRVSPTALTRSVPNMAASEVATGLGAHGPSFTVASACASGATALGLARALLAAGTCDVVLAGGAESGRSRMTATCFAQLQALSRRTDAPAAASRPFDEEHDGFVLSEGAAVLVLERQDHARRRGAHVRALLLGHAATSDAHHPVAPHPEGEGAERAIRTALADAGREPADVDLVSAHGTSTPPGDRAEALALRRVFGGGGPPVTAPKSVLGHALGAAGAIEAGLAVLAIEQRCVLPTANLGRQEPGLELDIATGRPRPAEVNIAMTNSFGFGGHNSVLVLSRPR